MRKRGLGRVVKARGCNARSQGLDSYNLATSELTVTLAWFGVTVGPDRHDRLAKARTGTDQWIWRKRK